MKRLASKEARLGRGRSVALFYKKSWKFYKELERKQKALRDAILRRAGKEAGARQGTFRGVVL